MFFFTTFRKLFTHWFQKQITQPHFLGQVLRKYRRFYLGSFNPRYVQKMIQDTREGNCHRCGLCCELVYKCPFLGRDHYNLTYCRVYGELRPANCRNYPFDVIDAEVATCGYRFKWPSSQQPSSVQQSK